MVTLSSWTRWIVSRETRSEDVYHIHYTQYSMSKRVLSEIDVNVPSKRAKSDNVIVIDDSDEEVEVVSA